MDPITFAVTVFGLLASAGVAWAKHSIDSAEQKSQNDKINSLNEQNLALNEKTAQQNFDLSKEQFEYQKQLNDLTMQREDTAFQRQVSDLKAAGLSPLMVAGNGAAATPLNTANAPQFDMSGINQAMSNMIGSYNDIFNRKMQSKQFALQSKVQTAQTYTQLAELKMQRKKADLENNYLSEKLKWEKTHGFRDLNWKSEVINVLEDFIDKYKGNSVLPNVEDINFNTAGWSLPSKEKLYESVFGKEPEKTYTYNPVKIKKETDQLNKNISDDYKHAVNIITTRSPTKGNLNDKKYMDSVNYFYRFTNAWRDYETVDDFINNFLSDPDKRKKIQSIYPFIERKTLR